MSAEQVELVKKRLFDYNRPFCKFMMIFYYSGGRETELLKLKGRDVDLVNQTYKTEVLKGQQSVITRTIRTISLPYWEEHMLNYSPDDFVFSNHLLPSSSAIHPKQINNRWKKWVKVPMGITVDFYALKHLNAGELLAAVGLEAAAAQMGHRSTEMVKKRYGKKRLKKKITRI